MSIDALIGAIYEAGALPQLWPNVLEQVALAVNALGGNLIRATTTELRLHSTPSVAAVTQEFDRQGWNKVNTRVGRLLERAIHPGFLTDRDLHTRKEMRTLPIYAEFLTPRGFDAGAATLLPGPGNEVLIFALEAFPGHGAARRAIPLLNRLRPHLARAATLSTQVEAAGTDTLVQAFDALGTSVALLDFNGRILGMSAAFADRSMPFLRLKDGRLRLLKAERNTLFDAALGEAIVHGKGQSVALRSEDGDAAGVLHLVPASRTAENLFRRTSILALLATASNEMLPAADIIAALFDLTPAEARIARGIAQGRSVAELASSLAVSPETVRSQLKRVFAKTMTQRQAELSLLLSRLG